MVRTTYPQHIFPKLMCCWSRTTVSSNSRNRRHSSANPMRPSFFLATPFHSMKKPLAVAFASYYKTADIQTLGRFSFLPFGYLLLVPLQDPTATNMAECEEYVARAEVGEGRVFLHQSEHASFQIVTPTATVRLSHGRLHQVAMRDPTDQYDLPDHVTWQMNMAVDHNEVSHACMHACHSRIFCERPPSEVGRVESSNAQKNQRLYGG